MIGYTDKVSHDINHNDACLDISEAKREGKGQEENADVSHFIRSTIQGRR